MRILLTGATGFIGRHLLDGLSGAGEENVVYAVARRVPQNTSASVRWVPADLSSCDWTTHLPDGGVDVVVHLAQSKHYRDFPSQAVDIFDVNVKATVDLAGWAAVRGVKRFLFASTGNVYGFQEQVHQEGDVCKPDSMYAASKLSAEILLKPFSPSYEVVILRLFGVYGPGQTDAMVPGVIQRFIESREITLAGEIGVRFNPIYIDDCVVVFRQLLAVKLASSYEIVNVGGSEVVDLRQAVAQLEAMSGRPACVRSTADVPKQLVGSIDRLRKLVTPEKVVLFREGLRRVLVSMDPRGQGER